MVGRDRDPDARGHRHFVASDRDRRLERREHTLGERQRFRFVFEFLGEDHELVAAEASDRVAVAHHPAQPRRHSRQHAVAYLMTVAVVDELEAVEVDEDQCDESLASLQARDRLPRAVHQ